MIDGYAVDLGGTKTAVARIVAGRVEDRLQARTHGQASVSEQIDFVADMLGRIGFRPGTRLGVAVAGRIDAAGRWLAVNTATLSGLGDDILIDLLRQRLGGDIRVMNDAAAATLAEARLGAGIGADHFAYLTVSTGVGGGVILNGHLVQSRDGLAGHVGFISSPFGNGPCGSGRRGTVESVASGRAISLAAGTEDAKMAFDVMTSAAQAAIDRSARAIATLCADLNSVFGLDRIAIGGSVGLAAGYLPRVVSSLAKEPELFRVAVVPATLGHDSALLGALISEGERG